MGLCGSALASVRFRGQNHGSYGAKLWEFWVVTLRVRDEKYGTFSGYVAESSRRRRSLESLAFPTRVGAIPRLESATSSTRVGDAEVSTRKTTKKEPESNAFRLLVISKSYSVSFIISDMLQSNLP